MTRFARWRKTYNTSIQEDSREEPYNASYGNFSKLVRIFLAQNLLNTWIFFRNASSAGCLVILLKTALLVLIKIFATTVDPMSIL
jgi:ABC-type protease/lipase transport system fused ATPase/permease subunit